MKRPRPGNAAPVHGWCVYWRMPNREEWHPDIRTLRGTARRRRLGLARCVRVRLSLEV